MPLHRRPALRRTRGAKPQRAGKAEGRLAPPLEDQAVTDFGLRPRRATAVPGIDAAQSSQRSACFAPRRASVNGTRNVAPRASATSLLQLSQTRTVLRATFPPKGGNRDGRDVSESRGNS